MDTSKSSSAGFQIPIWVTSTELFGDVGLVFVKVTGDFFFKWKGIPQCWLNFHYLAKDSAVSEPLRTDLEKHKTEFYSFTFTKS